MHLSSLGHPIFGDSLYGTEDEEFISRQALHAYGLDFYSPKTQGTFKFKGRSSRGYERVNK